jgi:hypothetical protein
MVAPPGVVTWLSEEPDCAKDPVGLFSGEDDEPKTVSI